MADKDSASSGNNNNDASGDYSIHTSDEVEPSTYTGGLMGMMKEYSRKERETRMDDYGKQGYEQMKDYINK